jgi:hypothetical protein
MQSDDPLNDAALDRELERALAVDPSPEFVARVRGRIADQAPRASTWNRPWLFAGGPIAAIVIILIAIQLGDRREAPATGPLLAARAVAPVTGELMDRAAGAVALHARQTVDARRLATRQPREFPAAHGRRAVQAIAVAQDPAAEVLLDPRETTALQALIAGVRSGRVNLDPVVRASVPTAMDLPPVDAIVIPPITIEPLAPAGAEGVRQ